MVTVHTDIVTPWHALFDIHRHICALTRALLRYITFNTHSLAQVQVNDLVGREKKENEQVGDWRNDAAN